MLLYVNWVIAIILKSYLKHCLSSTPEQLESLAHAAKASPRVVFESYTCPAQLVPSVLTNDVGHGSNVGFLYATHYFIKDKKCSKSYPKILNYVRKQQLHYISPDLSIRTVPQNIVTYWKCVH